VNALGPTLGSTFGPTLGSTFGPTFGSTLGSTFGVSVRFLSDWHVGTGEGRVGVVDALVRRDQDGLPYVPAKTLLGVWRDACETVASTLDGAPRGRWAAWVDWLFGSQPSEPGDATAARRQPPARALVSLTPARMPDGLRAAVHGKPALVEATVLLRPGVGLHDDTGTAEEDMLRLEERALRGTLLLATATVHGVDGGLPAPAEVLLRAGARLVEALGGKRNRGSGRLVLRLDGVVEAAVADDPRREPPPDERLTALLADDALLEDPGRPPEAVEPFAPVLASGRRGQGRRRWRLELEALTPVVVVNRVVGNNITTRRVLPGTTLLPAVLSRLPDPRAVGLDDVRVGDAVPAVVDDEGTARPGLPGPLTWHRADKGQGESVVNAALTRPDPTARYKPARQPVARSGAEDGRGTRWRVVAPGTAVSTHAVVNDVHRRPTEDAGGGLFSYHGIEAGTVLVSDLVLPEGVELVLTPGEELRVGRSRKDDFGRVTVRRLAPLPDAPVRQVGADGTLRVWLTSDVLLRDERLAPDPSPQRLGTVLESALGGIELTVVAHDPVLRPTLTQAIRRDGFAPRWGRHRVTLVGLKAGSVVTFRLPADAVVPPDKVAEVERDGIGDRTVEGFGRVLLDPPELLTARPTVERPSRGDQPLAPAPTSAAPTELRAEPRGELQDVAPDAPHPVELAAWRREVRRRVAAIAVDPREGVGLPDLRRAGRAQRGVLRAQVDRLVLPGGDRLVQEWFASLRMSVTRRDAWDEATLDRLEQLLLRGQVWAALRLDDQAQAELVLTPGRERLLRDALTAEAVAVLIDELARQSQADEAAGTGTSPETGTGTSPETGTETGTGTGTETGPGTTGTGPETGTGTGTESTPETTAEVR
jgi:CRISPR-associated protein Csx10